jgi:hypothetical protein
MAFAAFVLFARDPWADRGGTGLVMDPRLQVFPLGADTMEKGAGSPEFGCPV